MNEFYPQLDKKSVYHFSEFYELSGQISNENPLQKAFVDQTQGANQLGKKQIPFTALMIVFDLNNLKSLLNLQLYLESLKMFDNGDDQLDMMQLMNKYPVLIVGSKKDLVDHNKAGYLLISTKV